MSSNVNDVIIETDDYIEILLSFRNVMNDMIKKSNDTHFRNSLAIVKRELMNRVILPYATNDQLKRHNIKF
ncbi:MAG: hypothetical protein ACFE9S_19145 [Candidatus Hermodarchaeota archaeon]